MFKTVESIKKSFDKFNEIERFTKEEKENISTIPILEFIKKGGRFNDDIYFGDEKYKFCFTDEAIKSLCYKVSLPVQIIDMINEKGLTSKVLNDIFTNDNINETLKTGQFVIDERKINKENFNSFHGRICGVITDKYAKYSNYDFINDIRNILDEKINIRTCYSINTKLHIRFTDSYRYGVIQLGQITSEDKTEIGFEFCNSMVGDTSVSIDFFLYRLLCSNGLILPASHMNSRIIHSGKKSFSDRIKKEFECVKLKVGEKMNFIKELSCINFSPKQLVEAGAGNLIFDIIPRSKSTILNHYKDKFKKYYFKKLSLEEKKEKEQSIISLLPTLYKSKYSGAVFNSSFRDNVNMFDFINLFTEYANEHSYDIKIEIQKKAGDLADWIVKNKKKFN